VVLRRTAVGYEWRVIGSSERTAAYAGMNVRRQIVAVLVVSGALAGIAGATQIQSVTYALEPRSIEAGGLGFTGIVVAVVAGMSPGAIVFAAFVIAGITSSGPSLSAIGISPSSVVVMQGVLLLAVAAGQFFNSFTIRRRVPVPAVVVMGEAA
jgi:simple sugar transport system permease protein